MIILVLLAAMAGPAEQPKATINEHGVVKVYGAVAPSGGMATSSDPLVCKRFVQPGSHFAARTCKLKSEWEAVKADAQRNLLVKQQRGNCAYGGAC